MKLCLSWCLPISLLLEFSGCFQYLSIILAATEILRISTSPVINIIFEIMGMFFSANCSDSKIVLQNGGIIEHSQNTAHRGACVFLTLVIY